MKGKKKMKKRTKIALGIIVVLVLAGGCGRNREEENRKQVQEKSAEQKSTQNNQKSQNEKLIKRFELLIHLIEPVDPLCHIHQQAEIRWIFSFR